ncbi:MAG: copper amine oxidase [Firmicutes bacterium]|nr:copper amine oxidase [Bacillota bacterium]
MVFLILVCAGPAYAQVHAGITNGDRMYIPLRGVFEEIGCNVSWDGGTKAVAISNDRLQVKLTVGSREVTVSDSAITTENPPLMRNGRVYIPLRFCAETLGAAVDWDPAAREAVVSYDGKSITVTTAHESSGSPGNIRNTGNNGGISGIKHYTKKVDGISANVIEIAPGAAVPTVVLAQDRIGGTEELASMASRSGAKVAINGTFFEAYDGVPEPWGTLIKNGQVVHVGSVGTTVGFTASGQVKMSPVEINIQGGQDGSYSWPGNWYAYGFNRTPTGNSVYIYTRERGTNVGFKSGINVVVSGGKVTNITRGENSAIPGDGFVINLSGSEEYLADRFSLGDTVQYRANLNAGDGSDWSDVITAVGAGPGLVTNGVISANPAVEGFTSEKILTMAGARSAIGAKKDGTIMLVTVPGATIEKAASVMKGLGAYNAMNLDGGASSGLWYNGKHITRPGRQLSNALIFK